jgi:hypothetical protein
VAPSDKPRLSLAERLDDGIVLGWAFRLILLGSVVVLALDLGELRDGTPDAPISPASRETMLPPALSDGEAPAPPHQITTDPDILKNAASFDLIGGGVLRVQGAIDPGAAARFETEIAARGEYVTTIVLNSPGGSVDDALRMSQIIRDNEFSTRVESGDLCASSCPLVMAGGVERSAGPEAVIGVHQVYGVSDGAVSSAEAMSRAQNVTARVSRHLAAMGHRPRPLASRPGYTARPALLSEPGGTSGIRYGHRDGHRRGHRSLINPGSGRRRESFASSG